MVLSYGIMTLIGLLILIFQWIGVIAFRKSRSRPAYLCMITGTVLTSLGRLLGILQILGLQAFTVPIPVFGYSSALSFTWNFGSLIFMIGFAIEGLTRAKIQSRIEELEMINIAQATELERLRNR